LAAEAAAQLKRCSTHDPSLSTTPVFTTIRVDPDALVRVGERSSPGFGIRGKKNLPGFAPPVGGTRPYVVEVR